LRIKHGSTLVPVYRNLVRAYTRYTVTFWLNQKRIRRTFADLEAAKTEARLAAQKIQEGFSSHDDLNPQERETFLAARRLLAASNTPLLNVVEECLECRKRLGPFPLLSAVDEFLRRSQGVKLQSVVPDICGRVHCIKRGSKVQRIADQK
jgi:hypothetical protein